jgi:RimJ/RimL family protein N-acetyltransferase
MIKPLNPNYLNGKPYMDWIIDPIVNQYNSHAAFPINKKDINDFISSIENKEKIVWSIHAAQDIYVGNTSIQSIDWLNRSAEIAILIGDKDYWSKGIGKVVCKLLLYHGFYKLNLHRIWLGALNINYAMRHIAAKIGMREEGSKREAFLFEGRYEDLIFYSILFNEVKNINELLMD